MLVLYFGVKKPSEKPRTVRLQLGAVPGWGLAMRGWEGCESVSAGKVNPEGGGPASWCDKKVATTPRWGIRTRSDGVPIAWKQARLWEEDDDVGLKSSRKCRPRKV